MTNIELLRFRLSQGVPSTALMDLLMHLDASCLWFDAPVLHTLVDKLNLLQT